MPQAVLSSVHLLGAAAQALARNAAVIADVLANARVVNANGRKVTALLAEARRVEATSPARAAALRCEVQRLTQA